MADDTHVPQARYSDAQRAAALTQIREAGAADWTALLAKALITRENWDHAVAELEEDETAAGPNDGEWNGWHVLNHTGASLALGAKYVRELAAGKTIDFSVAEQWQGDEKTFGEVRSGAIRGWDEFIGAVTEVAMAQPEEQTWEHSMLGEMTLRELVALVLRHGETHARQMREIRGLEADENPGDPAGELGKRRQTAH